LLAKFLELNKNLWNLNYVRPSIPVLGEIYTKSGLIPNTSIGRTIGTFLIAICVCAVIISAFGNN